MITLALKAKENPLIEFHATQKGATFYPYRAGNLVAFWRTVAEAQAELPRTQLILPLMEMFEVSFVPMADVEAALRGRELALMNMSTEPPHFPFDLVYAIRAEDVVRMQGQGGAR